MTVTALRPYMIVFWAIVALQIGETFTIPSASIGEVQRINIYAPPEYAESTGLRLPVRTMRPFLLVGIENTERNPD